MKKTSIKASRKTSARKDAFSVGIILCTTIGALRMKPSYSTGGGRMGKTRGRNPNLHSENGAPTPAELKRWQRRRDTLEKFERIRSHEMKME